MKHLSTRLVIRLMLMASNVSPSSSAHAACPEGLNEIRDAQGAYCVDMSRNAAVEQCPPSGWTRYRGLPRCMRSPDWQCTNPDKCGQAINARDHGASPYSGHGR